MGVDIAIMKFFDAVADKGGVKGPMLALGSLTIRESSEAIATFASRNGHARLAKSGAARDLFADRFGVERYEDCDINDLADHHIDLSEPLDQKYKGAFNTVFNGGTVEHIFDLRRAIENMHLMVPAGGAIIHTVPVTWFDHGLINLNPILFHSLAVANRYETLASGYYFSPGSFEGQTKPIVWLDGDDPVIEAAGRTVQEVLSPPALPANMMFLIAHRRVEDSPFVIPYQIGYE